MNQPMLLHSFEETKMSDLAFASWLVKRDGLDDSKTVGRFTLWRDPSKHVIAIAKRDDWRSPRIVKTWIRKD